ncbi:MAG: ABC transporter ATP-binding protein [Acidimicrobiia bacterium]|nr:ABC transporter ATP-binding protein [Acidimicrobiia bacterium]
MVSTVARSTRPLVVTEVSKTYHDGRSTVSALERLSLDVSDREFVCLVGASGCGKTTLLNLIAGIYHLDQGAIDTGGRRIGVVFQEPALFPWLTVRRNIDLAMRLRDVDPATRRARADDLLRLVHLERFGDHRPHELSGGMQQRAALARALAQDAELLLMDEPFGALDAMTRDRLHDELERIWLGSDLSVLFVTHNVREAVRLGDRVVVLSSRPGRVAAEFAIDIPRPRRIDSEPVARRAAEITDRLRQEVRRHGR